MNKKRGKHKKAVDCVTADEKIVGELLNEDEWEQFECKEANAKPSDLLKAVVAMVNTSGGILIIGLKDAKNAKGKKRLIGIGMHRNNISQFLVKITNIQPQLNEPCEERYIPIKNIHGHSDEILVLDIKKGKQVHALDGNTYVRRGSSSIKIGPSEIRNLEIDRGVVKFEDEISNVSELDDLDHDLLDRYKEDTKTSQDNQSILRSIGLIKEKDSKEYLIEAGILLFGKEPVVSLRRKCGIRVIHYRGVKVEHSGTMNFGRDPFTIGGNLYGQIDNTIKHFREIYRESPKVLEDGFFRPNIRIPEDVFHEAVTNAVIHRNYLLSDDIQVRFFDDRIEVESPGTYPGNVTSNNIRHTRCARNVLIERTLDKFSVSPNHNIGEGVKRMFALMEKEGLYPPYYVPQNACPHSVLLVLYNMRRDESWEPVSSYLDDCHSITNKEARGVTSIDSPTVMSRLLSKWVDMGLLEKVGTAKRNAYYRKRGDVERFRRQFLWEK